MTKYFMATNIFEEVPSHHNKRSFFVDFRGPADHLQLRLPDRRLEPQELHSVRLHLQLRHAHVGGHLLLLADRQGCRLARSFSQEASCQDERGKLEIKRRKLSK